MEENNAEKNAEKEQNQNDDKGEKEGEEEQELREKEKTRMHRELEKQQEKAKKKEEKQRKKQEKIKIREEKLKEKTGLKQEAKEKEIKKSKSGAENQPIKSWYDKWHKILLIFPIILLLISLIYLGFFYSKNKDIMYRDVSLTGGTTITLSKSIDSTNLESPLKLKYPDAVFRKLTDLRTGEQIALTIEVSAQPQEIKESIEKILGYNLTDEDVSIEFTGPTLSQSFYVELMKVVLISFILMALVVFLVFGKSNTKKATAISLSLCATKLTFLNKPWISAIVIVVGIVSIIYILLKKENRRDYLYAILSAITLLFVFLFQIYSTIFLIVIVLLVLYLLKSLPSIAVIFAAFSDIVMALAVVDILKIKLSAAGIAAFLMLIGYSVDTDILLTSRALKGGEGTLNKRIFGAFKTGILMTLTALIAILPAFFIVSGLPDSFRQIFLILALGLSADIINTWLANASIIKWYCDKKGIK